MTDKEKSSESKVVLSLQKKVKVIRYMEAYGEFEMVVEIGSSLGVWIGLSHLECLTLFYKVGLPSRKKIFKFYFIAKG